MFGVGCFVFGCKVYLIYDINFRIFGFSYRLMICLLKEYSF